MDQNQRRLDRRSDPNGQNFLGAGGFDLLPEAAVIELQQRVVAFVGRAADAVSNQDDTESTVSLVNQFRRLSKVALI
jgi:hypothetical protein